MNTVAACLGPDIDNRVAKASCGRIENLVLIRDANGHGVDEDIAIISRVEIGFAAHGGNANAIAIAANARNHALHKMLHLGMVGASEAQGVHIRHGARAHCEHVAQDAANARRCTLIGFDVRWVVVRFHFEDRGKLTAVRAFANVDNAGILAGAANDPRRLCRQFLQMDA